jgi:hypothetical protein
MDLEHGRVLHDWGGVCTVHKVVQEVVHSSRLFRFAFWGGHACVSFQHEMFQLLGTVHAVLAFCAQMAHGSLDSHGSSSAIPNTDFPCSKVTRPGVLSAHHRPAWGSGSPT